MEFSAIFLERLESIVLKFLVKVSLRFLVCVCMSLLVSAFAVSCVFPLTCLFCPFVVVVTSLDGGLVPFLVLGRCRHGEKGVFPFTLLLLQVDVELGYLLHYFL